MQRKQYTRIEIEKGLQEYARKLKAQQSRAQAIEVLETVGAILAVPLTVITFLLVLIAL